MTFILLSNYGSPSSEPVLIWVEKYIQDMQDENLESINQNNNNQKEN